MPGLVRKLVIFAALHGVILQPLGAKKSQASQIAYKDSSIGPALKDGGEIGSSGKGFEAFGIVGECSSHSREAVILGFPRLPRIFDRVGEPALTLLQTGLLTLSKSSFLISITRRRQVAQIQGKPIYVITEVALTPLHSRAEAESAIAHTKATLQKRRVDSHAMDESDTEDDEGEFSGVGDDVEDDHDEMPREDGPLSHADHKRTSSVAEDVMTRKGGYGRFAQKWFSRKGWTVGQRRNLGMSVSESETEPEPQRETTVSTSALTPDSAQKEEPVPSASDVDKTDDKDIAESLLPKLLRTTQILLGSRNFFFSYDYDITRSFANRRTTNSELPLYTEVDPLFFWNRSLIQPFINVGQSPLVLPLIQGFVGQLSFQMDSDPPIIGLDGAEKSSMEMTDLSAGGAVDDPSPAIDRRRSGGSRHTEKSFLLTLISRRSVKRAGLRYLRRGVDEEGDTANGVETEQILSDPDWTPSCKVHSFVQIRGSIPIFFSQTPYSFKPVPQIQHSDETNAKAFKKHFGKGKTLLLSGL
jgi:hypothetical protein